MLAGPLEGSVALTVSTPDWVFGFHRFLPDGADVFVDAVSRTAFFGANVAFDSEFEIPPFAFAIIDGQFGGFTGGVSFNGFAVAIPEPSVMFLMLASGLLLSTKAVFRRIN